MKYASMLLVIVALGLTGCAAPTGGGVKRTQIRDCPAGMVLFCESRNEPSTGGEEEIPEYERCRCESIM